MHRQTSSKYLQCKDSLFTESEFCELYSMQQNAIIVYHIGS